MFRNPDVLRHALLRALLIAVLTVPGTACAGAPGSTVRPEARPDPTTELQRRPRIEAEAQDAYESELRGDWLDWQLDPSGTYREFLHERQEAAREAREREREERLQQPSPETGGHGLAERIEERRGESFGRLEERTPEQRLRPDTLRRNRPGLRN